MALLCAYGGIRWIGSMTTTNLADPSRASGSDFAALSRRIAAAGLLRRRPGYYAAAARRGRRRCSSAAGPPSSLVGDSWWQLLVAVVPRGGVRPDRARRPRPGPPAGLPHPPPQRDRRAARRQPRHRHELRLVDGQAHPPPRQPQPRGPATRTSPPTSWSGRSEQAARAAGAGPAHRPPAGVPVLPAAHAGGLQPARRPASGRCSSPAMRHRAVGGAAAGRARRRLPRRCCSPCSRRARRWPSSLLHQAIFGVYLGCTFAPNHKGMPTLTGRGRASTSCAGRC